MAKSGVVEYVASLERGLRVLQTFSREHSQLTLSEVAALTKLSPATARRSLHTLEPFLMSPRCTTDRTAGSALICWIQAGNFASWSAPYGTSPMTANV